MFSVSACVCSVFLSLSLSLSLSPSLSLSFSVCLSCVFVCVCMPVCGGGWVGACVVCVYADAGVCGGGWVSVWCVYASVCVCIPLLCVCGVCMPVCMCVFVSCQFRCLCGVCMPVCVGGGWVGACVCVCMCVGGACVCEAFVACVRLMFTGCAVFAGTVTRMTEPSRRTPTPPGSSPGTS